MNSAFGRKCDSLDYDSWLFNYLSEPQSEPIFVCLSPRVCCVTLCLDYSNNPRTFTPSQPAVVLKTPRTFFPVTPPPFPFTPIVWLRQISRARSRASVTKSGNKILIKTSVFIAKRAIQKCILYRRRDKPRVGSKQTRKKPKAGLNLVRAPERQEGETNKENPPRPGLSLFEPQSDRKGGRKEGKICI